MTIDKEYNNDGNKDYLILNLEGGFVINIDGFDFEVRNGLITSVYKNNNMIFKYIGEVK